MRLLQLTDDLASGAARVDEPLSRAELWREAAADEGVQDAVATISHDRGVARQLVLLQGCGGATQDGSENLLMRNTTSNQHHHSAPPAHSHLSGEPAASGNPSFAG